MIDFKNKLIGTIVPIPSFYKYNNSIDIAQYKAFINFQLKAGSKNFYLALSASEFEFMDQEERLQVTKAIADELHKDCILLGQPLGNVGIQSQIDEGNKMHDLGVDALVVKPQGLKEGSNFFSSRYLRRNYNPKVHNTYYYNYMKKFSESTYLPLVFHDFPFSSGVGLNIEGFKLLLKNKRIQSFKLHSPDPGYMKETYLLIKDKTASFDGFGKTLQFWSLTWGAKARHSCWSWFEPKADQLFYKHMIKKDYKKAIHIMEREWPIIKVIRKTGYSGYRHLMSLIGLKYSKSRVPGESLSKSQILEINRAFKEIKKIKIN